MRQGHFLWALLLCLALTACASGSGEPPAAEVEANEPARESPRILYEEAIEYTNQEELSNGFVLAEREENGERFLEFTRPDVPEFSLKINQDLTEAVVAYQGKTMALERVETPNGALYDWYVSAGYGGLVSGYSMPFWTDMTGDGQPELLWLRQGYGTGFRGGNCTVYNISGQGEIIPLVEPWEEMAALITVEPLIWEDGCIRCRVTDSEGSSCIAWQDAREENWREYRYFPVKSGYTGYEIDPERGIVEAVMAFGLESPDIICPMYMGEMWTELAYDAEQRAIVRSGPVLVTAYERPER